MLLLVLLLVPSALPEAGSTEAVPVPGIVVPVPVAGTTTVVAVPVAGTTATLLLDRWFLRSSPRILIQKGSGHTDPIAGARLDGGHI